MTIESRYIDRIIQKQAEYVKWRILFALFIVLLGVSIFFITNHNSPEGQLKTITSIGSALVLTITGWPIKEIIDKKNSIQMFKDFKTDLSYFENNNLLQSDEFHKIKEYIWKTVEKLAVA